LRHDRSHFAIWQHRTSYGCEIEKKNYASSKKLLALIKEKEPLGKKSPFTRKEKGT